MQFWHKQYWFHDINNTVQNSSIAISKVCLKLLKPVYSSINLCDKAQRLNRDEIRLLDTCKYTFISLTAWRQLWRCAMAETAVLQ